MSIETNTRWKRIIKMFDINWKKLSNSSLKSANIFYKKWFWKWIEEWKSFQLNHEIKYVTPTKTLFDKIYDNQWWLCNRTNEKISKRDWELHHKFIPKNIFVCNKIWNLEILSKKEHKRLHNEDNNIVNFLIKVWIFKNKHKNLKKSFKYYLKKIYIFFKYKKYKI